MISSKPLLFPECQSEVSESLRIARERMKFLQAQIKSVVGHIQGIQDFCEHPKNKQIHGVDMSGCGYSRCLVCERER